MISGAAKAAARAAMSAADFDRLQHRIVDTHRTSLLFWAAPP
jgi:hypothetical protein